MPNNLAVQGNIAALAESFGPSLRETAQGETV
jgi:hypothetical protein